MVVSFVFHSSMVTSFYSFSLQTLHNKISLSESVEYLVLSKYFRISQTQPTDVIYNHKATPFTLKPEVMFFR